MTAGRRVVVLALLLVLLLSVLLLLLVPCGSSVAPAAAAASWGLMLNARACRFACCFALPHSDTIPGTSRSTSGRLLCACCLRVVARAHGMQVSQSVRRSILAKHHNLA